LQIIAGAGLWEAVPRRVCAAPFPNRRIKAHPYEALFSCIEPGHDEFEAEKEAAEITAHLERLPRTRTLPLDTGFQGASPMPARYRAVAEGLAQAEYDLLDRNFETGLAQWLAGLGDIRSTRFFVLPGDRVRYEIASSAADGLHYRVGVWRQQWVNGKLARFEPIEETLASSPRPLFQDVTQALFGDTESFRLQLLPGVPFWRAALDSASGIDVYGNQGIAVGDMDGDGRDEVYVCQPGGLPNRLYRARPDGTMEDITETAGVGVLDDSPCALFLDLRNTGRQDLVVVTTQQPLLFLNQGDGTFRHKPDAFRFHSPPQGTFTGIAAADYDLDGRLDLYLCTYIYYQSEDQYRYPVPYYESENGPPNFLFHNELTADGGGSFQDVTQSTGISENNNRYSFAPAWCDYDGDGWPDLYVANDFGLNNLYRNTRGRFRDIAEEAGVADLGPGMSAAWFDYDGDGRPDLYVSNMWTACGQRIVEDRAFAAAADGALRGAYRKHTKGNSLYRNRGDGAFEYRGAAEGVEMGRWAWAADGIDFDNDGSPEIYVTCGMLTNSSEFDLMSFFWRQVVARSPTSNAPVPAYENGWNAINQLIRGDYSWSGREPNVLYARHGGRYFDVSGISGLDFAEDSRAFAATDLDGDGNLDLLLKSRLGPQVRALRNHWGTGRPAVAFELRGTKSNRDAIGARVEVEHGGKRTVKFLNAGSGYLSQHTKRLHFGLGEATATGKVIVRWPSGLQQEFNGLDAGFCYHIIEGSDEVRRTRFAKRAPEADRPAPAGQNEPQAVPVSLLEPVPLPEVRKGPGFLCMFSGEPPAVPASQPFELLDLTNRPDLRDLYSLFQMYLLDYRVDLTMPLVLLLDGRGMAHKIYPAVPSADILRADLSQLTGGNDNARGLPFRGKYYSPPGRNYFRLGAAFYWAGHPEEALIYLDQAVRRHPDNSKAHLAVGHIHLEAGRYGPARHHLERAVALSPGSTDGWTNLGGLEAALENHSAALRNFERALAIVPDSVFALVSAGREQGKLGRAVEAERTLRRALKVAPRDPEGANQLGLLLAAQNRTAEAAECFQQAIAAERDHSGAINNLGVLYVRMQKIQDAIAAFRYGIEVSPDEEIFYLNLARAYVASGDPVKARAILEQLLERQPGNAEAKKGLAELRPR
jgi:FimV-like protein